MCQAMEATAADMQSLGVKSELGEKVAAIDSRNSTRGTPYFATGQSKPKGCSAGPGKREPQRLEVCETGRETDGTSCSRCGLHHPPRWCPAYGQQCKKMFAV